LLLFHGYDRPTGPAQGLPLVDVLARSTTKDTTHIYPFHYPIIWFWYLSVPPVFHCQAGCVNHTSFSLGLLSLADLLCLYCWADAHDSASLWLLSEPGEFRSKQYTTIHSGLLRFNHLCQIRLRMRLDEVDAPYQSQSSTMLSYEPLFDLLLQRCTRPDHTMPVRSSNRTCSGGGHTSIVRRTHSIDTKLAE
jgi:hypothetical protein